MYNVHYLNKISPQGTALFTEEYTPVDNLEQAEAVLVRSANMHEMQLPEDLLAIARAGAGVNNIPLTSCADQGIVVFNTPGANANSVMELAICGMLLGSRDIVGGINWVQSIKGSPDVAKIVEKGKSQFAGHEIYGKKLGIIGLGAIGGPLANRSRKLGMDVYGCDPHISVEAAWHLDRHVQRVKTREEIFSQCDIISVHTPLLDDTRKMINAETIAMMKDGVILVNMARGAVTDEQALADALRDGGLGVLGVDVYSAEPMRAEHPFYSIRERENVCFTPHMAWGAYETRVRLLSEMAENIRSYLEGGKRNRVDL